MFSAQFKGSSVTRAFSPCATLARTKDPCHTIGALLAFLAVAVAAAQSPRVAITIDAAAPRVAVSPTLYGIFYEEINHAGEGGLYAEMVQNRDFEASTLEPGWTIDGDFAVSLVGWHIAKWFKSETPAWTFISEGDADGSMQLDSSNPLSERNPHSLRLTVNKLGQRCGIANSGFWGMNVQQGEWYNAIFFARVEGNRGIGLVFSLESEDGKKVCARTTLPEIGRGGEIGQAVSGTNWRRYEVSLRANASDPKCRLVISPIEPGTLWFDCVSLFPRKTFKGHGLRPDLAQMLVDLHPGFLRFPGGCVVEGVTPHNRIRWRDSVGDISQRQGGFDLWGYYATYGLGFHEFLQLADDLGADPMYVINVGMTCQSNSRRPAQVASDADLPMYIQDSLDAIEYATGPTTSELGAMRAANGHPEPFKLKYVEIGNENRGLDYQKHYKVFYDAIKAKYPQIITIADLRMPDVPMEFVDDHYYVNPARFFGMANYYDAIDRHGPKVYVGEYAVNNGVGSGNLIGALAEAVFMLNMERNSDLVKMCSYAPLFENVNDRRWAVNLIRFDSSRVVGRSSYQVQKLFGANRPDFVLKTVVQPSPYALTIPSTRPATQPTDVQQLYALGGLDEKRGEVVIKIVNPTPAATSAEIAISGFANVGGQAKKFTLGNPDATAENTLDQPNLIVPVETVMNVPGARFTCDCAPNSLTILRIPAR